MLIPVDIYTDGHVHTSLCNHASGTMEEYVKVAIAKGLRRLVFLEHLELGIKYFESTWLDEDDFDLYFEEGKRLKENYKDRIEVGMGVEVGYNPDAIDAILAFLEKYDWDRVGLSYHFIKEKGQHINMLSRKKANLDAFSQIGVSSIISRYFDGLILAVQQLPAQVLCHLDAVLRFHPDVQLNSKHQEQIELLLDMAVIQKIALEINTSGFVHRGAPYPQRWILQRAIEKNIPICLGSDAHNPDDVGRYFERIPDLLSV